MSFVRNAEHLIILGDVGSGYLNRVHLLLSFKRPPHLFTTELDKFTRSLLTRRYPELPNDLPKQSGFEPFRRNSDAIKTALSDYALTLVDCLAWLEAAWDALQAVASDPQLRFDLSINPDITHFFFTLLTRYVQLHLLIAQLDSPQVNLLGYYLASFLPSGGASYLSSPSNQSVIIPPSALDPDYLRTSSHFNTHGKTPLKQLQQDFTSISVTIGNALCLPSVSNLVFDYSKVRTYQERKVFTLDASNTLLHPSNDAKYADLINLDRVRQYVVYGFLVCPGELIRPGAVEMLKVALMHDVVVPLHRDVVLNVAKEYGELFENYTKGKLKKHKKTLKEATGDQQATLLFHAELRILLQLQGLALLPVLQDNPHALSPKLSLVLALLHACKEEVVWYVRHLGFHVFNAKVVKEREKVLFDDHVSPLIYLITELLALIDRNREAIQTYYLQYMQGLDLHSLLALVQPLTPQLDPVVRQLFDNICNALDGRSIADNFETVRLNWYRASIGLSSGKGKVDPATVAKVSAAMNTLVAHSRHVDCLDTEMRAHGSFASLYWYKEEVQQCFQQSLQGKDGQQAYSLSYVKTLHSALHNVHRLCPEEQNPIGRDIVSLADSLLKALTAKLEDYAEFIGREVAVLRQQTTPSQLMVRLASKSNLAPGYESIWENRKGVAGLRLSKAGVADVLASVEDEGDDGIVVYNVRVYAREYIVDMIATNLKRKLRQLCFDGPTMQKPAVILNRWRDAVYTFQVFERQLSFSLSDIARDVLLQEFAAEDEAGVEEKDDRPSIHGIAAWYGSIFTRDLSELGIVYSPLHSCFLTRPNFNPSSSNQAAFIPDMQRYTDPLNLTALVSLIGPAGVRILFATLMKLAATRVKVIKDVLAANAPLAKSMSKKFVDNVALGEALTQLKDADVLVWHAVSVGAILHFRALLSSALAAVVEQSVPFIGSTLELASSIAHRYTRCDPSLTVLDLLSADCGVDLHEADHLFRHIVSRLKTSVQDVGLFALIPEVFAMSLSAGRARAGQYLIDLQAYTNNLHCMALCVRHLIVDLNRVGVTASKESEAIINERIQADLERWLSCMGCVLLEMYQPSTSLHLGDRAGLLGMRDLAVGRASVEVVNAKIGVEVGGVSSLLLFLDVAVANSDGRLTYASLERAVPYTLLRENYSQLDEKQNPQIANFVAAQEEEKQ